MRILQINKFFYRRGGADSRRSEKQGLTSPNGTINMIGLSEDKKNVMAMRLTALSPKSVFGRLRK